MSQLAVEGFRAEREAILTVARTLTADECARPSACTGWSVRDVVGHMACTVHGVVDRAFLPNTPKGTPRGTEPSVVERRSWPVEAVVEEYETFSEQAGNLFENVQAAPLGEKVIPMADFGMHPLSILPSTYVLDAYTHLRNDILAPAGAVERPEPERDEMRLRPTVEWMLAVLPWMCAEALHDVVDASLTLALSGPGGGTWTLGPGGPEGRVALGEGTGTEAAATVRSTGHDFAMWGTRRTPWRDLVQIDGDEAYAGRVLDAIDIY